MSQVYTFRSKSVVPVVEEPVIEKPISIVPEKEGLDESDFPPLGMSIKKPQVKKSSAWEKPNIIEKLKADNNLKTFVAREQILPVFGKKKSPTQIRVAKPKKNKFSDDYYESSEGDEESDYSSESEDPPLDYRPKTDELF